MKTKLNLLPLLPATLLLALPVALAQDEPATEADQATYEAPEADTVVYEEPTTYYASVVYQSSVIYNAPVYYIAAGEALAISYAEQAQQAERAKQSAASTVIVVGGGSGTYTFESPPPSDAPSVIIQFSQRGNTWFGR